MRRQELTMKVCVTGANGFIASHIVKQLLDEGYNVNGCVRDATNEKKVNHLKEMDGASSRLTLFSTGNLGEGNDEKEDSESSLFDDAIRDCDAIMHAATPIAFGVEDGKKQIYDPAIISTKEILKSIERVASKTLKTFVLTSSMAAVSPKPEPTIKTEDCWSDEKLQIANGNWYGATKTAQEKLVLEYIKDFTASNKEGKGQPPFRFAAICPTIVFGPMLQSSSGNVNATMGYLQTMCKNGKGINKETGLQNKASNDSMSFIDVRDTASHHVKALQDSNAEGRYMSVTSTSLHWNDIFKLLKELYPSMPDVPDCDDEVLVQPTQFDHTKMNTLNVNCRSAKEILRDAIEDLKLKGHL
jgi:dihydroflavonol-4-reductase